MATLTQGALKAIIAAGSAEAVPKPVLKVKVIQEAIPGKKNRVVFLGDESDEIKAVLGAVPSGVLVANNIAPGTFLRLLDYTACQVKDKWALMVSSLEVAECLDQQMAENDAKKDESSELKQEVVKEEVKDETAVKDQEMEEPSTKVEQGAREESKSETVEEKGPAKKVRIMTETDSNRPAASPLPTKPEAAATPGSAAAKVPSVSPAQKGATPKENATPPSGMVKAPGAPTSTPRSGSASSRRIVPIRALNPYNETWTIKAKVMGKSEIRMFNMRTGGEGRVASMDLVDEEGTVILATMWRDFLDHHYESLQEGKVYFFTRGSVKPANKKYSSTKNDYELSFDSRTTVEECADQDTSGMEAKLDIVPIDKLPAHVGKKDPVDILAVVLNCGEEGTVKRKSDDTELRRVNVTLVDQSLKTVDCTLWNSFVDKVADLRGMDAPILSISNVRVSDYQGVSLSTVSRSVISINPESEEAKKLREWYDSEGRGASTQAAGEGLASTSPGRGQSRDTRETLKVIQPDEVPSPDEKATYHNALVSIAFISSGQNFYYMAHPETNRKVTEQGGAYFCEYDGKTSQTMRRRYVLSAKVMDFTGESWVSIFNDQAEMLLGCTADELAGEKEAGTQQGTERFEEMIKGSMWTDWQVRLMTKSREYNGEVKLRVNVQDMWPINYEKESKLLLQRISAMKA